MSRLVSTVPRQVKDRVLKAGTPSADRIASRRIDGSRALHTADNSQWVAGWLNLFKWVDSARHAELGLALLLLHQLVNVRRIPVEGRQSYLDSVASMVEWWTTSASLSSSSAQLTASGVKSTLRDFVFSSVTGQRGQVLASMVKRVGDADVTPFTLLGFKLLKKAVGKGTVEKLQSAAADKSCPIPELLSPCYCGAHIDSSAWLRPRVQHGLPMHRLSLLPCSLEAVPLDPSSSIVGPTRTIPMTATMTSPSPPARAANDRVATPSAAQTKRRHRLAPPRRSAGAPSAPALRPRASQPQPPPPTHFPNFKASNDYFAWLRGRSSDYSLAFEPVKSLAKYVVPLRVRTH